MITNVSNREIKRLRAVIDNDARITELAELYGLLANPRRLKVIILLTRQTELCVSELSRIIGISQPAVSQALKPLRDADVVATHRLGTQVCYRLVKPKLFKSLTAPPLDTHGSSLSLRFWQ